MKYRMTFDENKLSLALNVFCHETACKDCPVLKTRTYLDYLDCYKLLKDYPHKVAELIGLEAVKENPKLTQKELEICRALGAKWASVDKGKNKVGLWKCVPLYDGGVYFGTDAVGRVTLSSFPSLNPGDCVEIDK